MLCLVADQEVPAGGGLGRDRSAPGISAFFFAARSGVSRGSKLTITTSNSRPGSKLQRLERARRDRSGSACRASGTRSRRRPAPPGARRRARRGRAGAALVAERQVERHRLAQALVEADFGERAGGLLLRRSLAVLEIRRQSAAGAASASRNEDAAECRARSSGRTAAGASAGAVGGAGGAATGAGGREGRARPRARWRGRSGCARRRPAVDPAVALEQLAAAPGAAPRRSCSRVRLQARLGRQLRSAASGIGEAAGSFRRSA